MFTVPYCHTHSSPISPHAAASVELRPGAALVLLVVAAPPPLDELELVLPQPTLELDAEEQPEESVLVSVPEWVLVWALGLVLAWVPASALGWAPASVLGWVPASVLASSMPGLKCQLRRCRPQRRQPPANRAGFQRPPRSQQQWLAGL